MEGGRLDPGSLIESREALLVASRRWLQDPRPLREADERFAEVALVASDSVLWEPYACAFGYASDVGTEPLAVLLDLPFDRLFESLELARQAPFLAYSGPFATVALPEFAGGAYVLARHFGRVSFANSVPSLVCMEWCARHAADVDRCIVERCLG